ncbi:MAG TPA: hypothetical protein VEK55_05815, partial [Xanthobacteraceae bacterium]|nr:hypothetical protein [Xanthobacteraceae bacterium]
QINPGAAMGDGLLHCNLVAQKSDRAQWLKNEGCIAATLRQLMDVPNLRGSRPLVLNVRGARSRTRTVIFIGKTVASRQQVGKFSSSWRFLGRSRGLTRSAFAAVRA